MTAELTDLERLRLAEEGAGVRELTEAPKTKGKQDQKEDADD